MAKFKRIITAGPLVLEAVYPAPNPRDSVGVRAGKKALSSEAQQRMNLKYAYQKLELLMAANFGVRDLYITLTYDDEYLPTSRQEAQRRMQVFFRKLRAERKAKGQDTKYIYVTEHKHGDGRWHHHVILNATGDDFQLISHLWGQGGVEFKAIRVDRDKNYETLARYLCKEQREKLGLRLWSCSRNLAKPVRECCRVPNNTPLTPPPPSRATLLMDTGDIVTAYGHYRYVKYLVNGWGCKPAPKARRRRRK